MKRILASSVLVLILLVISTVPALANWGFDITATGDDNDGNINDGNATDFDITYWSDTGYVLYTNNITLFIGEFVGGIQQDAAISNVTPQAQDWSAPPFQDIPWSTNYLAGSSGDQGNYITVVFTSVGNIVHAMTSTGVTDPEPNPLSQRIAYVDTDNSIQLGFIEHLNFAVCENNNDGSPPSQIKIWRNDSSTYPPADNMGANNMLTHTGSSSEPVAPIPEIITIVLISIGLVSLGGYIWYRRKRQALVAA